MAIEQSRPSEWLGVAEILNAMRLNLGNLAGDAQPYLVIPGKDGPRWLIPARSRAAATVLSAWHPYDLSSRIIWFAIQMAARAGVLRFVPSVSIATVSRTVALQWFDKCGIASQTGEMVILVGVPSADRKLVAFLLDDAHRIAAVLKVGVTASGASSLLHEAEVLRQLEPYGLAPKLLSVHPDLRAAAQEYLPGEMPGRRFRPEFMDILCRLPLSGGSKNLAHLANEMAGRLLPFKPRLDEMAPGLLDRALDCLDLDLCVPTMLVHVDFAPWNMRKNPKRGYVLMDWEWAEFAGMPAYDLLHFHFNDDRLFGEKGGGYSAIRSSPLCAEYFRRMDLDAQLLPRLAIAYLLDQLESHCNHRGSELIGYTLRQLASVADTLGSTPGGSPRKPAL